MKKWRENLEEIERWLSLSAAERGTQWAYVSRTVPPPHEASRGLYTARAPSQESVMRNKGDRSLTSSSCTVSNSVIYWHQQPSLRVWWLGGSATFFLIREKKNYKGKSVVRENTRCRLYLA